jgi:kynureninase
MTKQWTLDDVLKLDADDPLAFKRNEFDLPEGVIYLDGNSLGALPVSTKDRIADVVTQEWGQDLIKSWNKNDWITMPTRLGNKIATMIGASDGEVIVADSTSVNLFKLVIAAVRMRPGRTKIISEKGNFPTDLYIMQGVVDLFPELELVMVDEGGLEAALDNQVAVVVITHVNYKSGRFHDMAGLTKKAHDVGALMLWDLCHSAGAMPVDLNGAKADFAVGCGYKYLNGGPGAPAFLFVAKHHQDTIQTPLSGWMGHAKPFSFDPYYEPAQGIERTLCGTPVVLGLAALDEGLKTFDGVSMEAIREKSKSLSSLFVDLVKSELGDYGFVLDSPEDVNQRASQVSLSHENGYAIMQALIANGVIGDFRAPDIVRFGFTPLYISHKNVWDAIQVLKNIMKNRIWQDTKFSVKNAVT